MSPYLAVLTLHVIGAAVLFGTGIGIAFFMLMAHRSGDPRIIAHTAEVVVIADFLFTATAVVLQPVSGAWLAANAGLPLLRGWIGASLALYALTGVFWLPVVWIQLRLRNLARAAAEQGAQLPPEYQRLWRIWFACGFPAFAAVIGIIWLMVAKPGL
ncbi:MAG TPA: DUF2269 domain-containing protein [Caulobacteraceae bacterium]|jgi:uncharacterized membrane protein